MDLKMDLGQEGLLMFFKPWQLQCLNTLRKKDKPISSREVWEPIKNEISRASVINFLEDMTENTLLMKSETTGKGGHRGLYKTVYDEAGTRQYLKRVFKQRLDQL